VSLCALIRLLLLVFIQFLPLSSDLACPVRSTHTRCHCAPLCTELRAALFFTLCTNCAVCCTLHIALPLCALVSFATLPSAVQASGRRCFRELKLHRWFQQSWPGSTDVDVWVKSLACEGTASVLSWSNDVMWCNHLAPSGRGVQGGTPTRRVFGSAQTLPSRRMQVWCTSDEFKVASDSCAKQAHAVAPA
jgi:hypothetical protein